MDEIRLPPELEQNEIYGSVGWTVRGICDGYVGWFDGNPSNMSSTPASAVYAEVVELAGGPEVIANRAGQLVEDGDFYRALYMADFALEADPDNRTALLAKRAALADLLVASVNLNEQGWLNAGIIEIDALLSAEGE
jgi:alkyl sulfatase BDS1-like metallo-beta-lactamase superfamily hydrolase